WLRRPIFQRAPFRPVILRLAEPPDRGARLANQEASPRRHGSGAALLPSGAVVEEIGMLDHLTGGRLEIGTAIGVPQELSRLNITMAEARERNEEIVAVLDGALANRAGSHTGKIFLVVRSAPVAADPAATVASAMDHHRQRGVRAAGRSTPDKNQHRLQFDAGDQAHL